MSLRLPEDKLNRLIDLVNTFSHKASASKRQLQSLAGSLNFACQVVRGGRTFIRREIDCINKLNVSSHRCRLSTDFRADVSWWKEFLVTFNGRRMMLDFRQPVYIQTDASFHGFGAVSPDDWFAGSWAPSPENDLYSQSLPSHWCDVSHAVDPSLRCNINYLELFPVLIAARRWDASWANKRICVENDNMQALAFVNKGSCKNPIAMSWLRELFWLSVRHNFNIRARHLAGINNVYADRLSRLIQSQTLSNDIFPPL